MNPYYEFDQLPVEAFVVEDLDADYSYNTILFLRDKNTNMVFFAADSGCSCPKPFEEYEGDTWNDIQSKMKRVVLREALSQFESYSGRANKTPGDLKKWWKENSKRPKS